MSFERLGARSGPIAQSTSGVAKATARPAADHRRARSRALRQVLTTTITTGTTASIANCPTTMTATAPAAMAADRGRRSVVGDGLVTVTDMGRPPECDHCSRLRALLSEWQSTAH